MRKELDTPKIGIQIVQQKRFFFFFFRWGENILVITFLYENNTW